MTTHGKRAILTVITCLTLAAPASAAIYGFEPLPPGALPGQDNWTGSSSAFVSLGAGLNTSHVFASDAGDAPASRINNPAFAFPIPAPSRTDYTIGFDFRRQPGTTFAVAGLALADQIFNYGGRLNPDTGLWEPNDIYPIGLSYYYMDAPPDGLTPDWLAVHDALGFGYYANLANTVEGHWYRAKMVVDMTYFGGDAEAQLFIKDLTAAGPWIPLEFNAGGSTVSLDLVEDTAHDSHYRGVNPANWDRLDAHVLGVTLDNLWVDGPEAAIPEPSTVSICLMVMALTLCRCRPGGGGLPASGHFPQLR